MLASVTGNSEKGAAAGAANLRLVPTQQHAIEAAAQFAEACLTSGRETEPSDVQEVVHLAGLYLFC